MITVRSAEKAGRTIVLLPVLIRHSSFVIRHFIFLLFGIGSACAQSASPSQARAYLYIDPYEARIEWLMRLDEMMLLLGEPSAAVLSPQALALIKDKVRTRISDWPRVKLEGEVTVPNLAGLSVVKGAPGRTEPIAPDADVTVSESMIGVMWDIPLQKIPMRVELEWKGFDERIKELPVTVTAGTWSANIRLERAYPKYIWENEGRVSMRQPLAEVPPLPASLKIPLPLGSLIIVVVGFFLVRAFKQEGRPAPGRQFMNWAIIVAGAALLWRIGVLEVPVPFTKRKIVSQREAEDILHSLLRNTYRAFDQREEGMIYDVLARSIQGELLQKIYLQTAQALSLDALDGTRVKVTDLSVTVDKVQGLSARQGFLAEGQWTALGTVGHWGHAHQRVNRYRAKLTVEPVDGAWKLSAVEIIEEKRM